MIKEILYQYFYDEETYLRNPFKSTSERLRFFQKMSLSYDAAILRYDPGDSYTTITYLWKLPSNISESDLLTSSSRIVQQLKQNLLEMGLNVIRE